MMAVDDPYKVLDISQDASEAEVKKAYRKAALKYHPDRHQNKEDKQEACDKFAEIAEAYDILTDPVKRYDWRSSHTTAATSTSTATKSTSNSSRSTTQAPSAPPPPPPATTTSPKQRSSPYASPKQRSSPYSSSFRKSTTASPHRHFNSKKGRTSIHVSPMSIRHKRTAHPPSAAAPPRSPRSSVRVFQKPVTSASPMPRKSHHIKKSPRSSVKKMAGSIHSAIRPPPLSAGASTQRRVIGASTISGPMPAPPLSVPTQRRGLSSQDSIHTNKKSRPSVRHPASANPTRQRIYLSGTQHRSSMMPAPPLYANMDTSRRSMINPRQSILSERSSRPGGRRQSMGPIQKPRRKGSVGSLRAKSSKTKKVARSLSQPPPPPPPPPPRNSIIFGMSLTSTKVHDSPGKTKEKKEKKKDKEKKKSKKKKKTKSSADSSVPPKKKRDKRSSGTRAIRRRSLPQ